MASVPSYQGPQKQGESALNEQPSGTDAAGQVGIEPSGRASRRVRAWMGLFFLLLTGLAWAAEPFTGFDSPSSRGITLPANFNGFHFEDKADSSVGWMHLIHLKNGGWITLLFTAANIGPYHLSTSIGASYTRAGEPVLICSEMWKDEDHFTAPKDRYWVRVANSYFGGKYPDFKAKVNDGGCQGEIKFTSIVPSFTQGSGVATFNADKSGKWRLIQISPRSKATGYLTFQGKRIEIDGDAYLEEVATDMTVPALADRWYLLRAVNGPYTINLFNIVVDKKNYGDGQIKTLLVARDNKIIMGTTNFNYQIQSNWTDKATGISVPNVFKLSARDGSTTLTGTLSYGKTLHSMSLLDKLPRMARMVAGVMYGTPYQYRSAADYDFVLNENGVQTPIKGTGYQEIHFYDR